MDTFFRIAARDVEFELEGSEDFVRQEMAPFLPQLSFASEAKDESATSFDSKPTLKSLMKPNPNYKDKLKEGSKSGIQLTTKLARRPKIAVL